MKRMVKKEFLSRLLLPLCGMAGLISCSVETDELNISDMSIAAYVEGVDLSVDRTTRAIGQTFESFSMYSMTAMNQINGSMLSDGIFYSKKAGVWTSNSPYYMDERLKMNAYGISPKVDYVSDPVFKWKEQSFSYVNPTTNQPMLKIGSKLGFTKAETNNRLTMGFNDIMYTLFFQAKNTLTIENCKVFIKGVIVHNLPTKAKFTYSSTIESSGEWTLDTDNVYVNFSQELSEPKELSSTLTDIMDSAFVLLPFVPTLWNPKNETLAEADANKHMYIEVLAQITQEIETDYGSKTVYLWGAKDGTGKYPQYESIIFQYQHLLNTKQAKWNQAYNGYYRLSISKTGYTKSGDLFEPHPDDEAGASEFTSSDPVDLTIVEDEDGNNVDPWSDDADNNSVVISM